MLVTWMREVCVVFYSLCYTGRHVGERGCMCLFALREVYIQGTVKDTAAATVQCVFEDIHVCTHVRACIRIHMYASKPSYIHPYIHGYIDTNTHNAFIDIYIYMYIYKCMHTYMYT